MEAYPLLLHPILKPRIWGGNSLARFGKAFPTGQKIGESWELADLPLDIPDGRSVIANGPQAGCSLHDLIQQHPRTILGSAHPAADGGFPLLIKYLDAHENLSVQVHPSPAYAMRNSGCHVKHEAWVILEARPNAVIYKGLRPGVTRARLADDLRAGTATDDLRAVPVRAGDCHYLPSGTCHALGAGIVVAEIQTPSDTTFRLYDWGRTGRELHMEAALACIDFSDFSAPSPPQRTPALPITSSNSLIECLTRTPSFTIERVTARTDVALELITNDLPEVWMLTSGSGDIALTRGSNVALSLGSTVLIPAALMQAWINLRVGASALRITLPSPMEGLIA